jgi:hypothetical protein
MLAMSKTGASAELDSRYRCKHQGVNGLARLCGADRIALNEGGVPSNWEFPN